MLVQTYPHCLLFLLSCISNFRTWISSCLEFILWSSVSEAVVGESLGFVSVRTSFFRPLERLGVTRMSLHGHRDSAVADRKPLSRRHLFGGFAVPSSPSATTPRIWCLESYDGSAVYFQCYAPWTRWGFRKCGVSSEEVSVMPLPILPLLHPGPSSRNSDCEPPLPAGRGFSLFHIFCPL